MRGSPSLILIVLAACGSDGNASSFAVLAVAPANDAVEVDLATAITIELSAPPATDFAVTLAAATGEPIPHALAVDGTTVTLTPTDPLWIATDYTLAIDAAVRSDANEPLGEAFGSKFTTRDGAWQTIPLHAQPMMAAAPLGAGAAPSLATLPDGTVLAGWEGGGELFDQKFTPATGWLGAPNRLDIVGGDPDGVEIAVASPTRAVAGHEKYVTRANIEARTYDGAQWSAPITVAPYMIGTTRYDQYLGGVAATEQSYALVFHRGSFDTELFDAYASIHANGAWGAPFLVEQLAGSASGAEVAADGRGGYVIAWIQRSADKLSTAVWVTTLSGTGAVGQPQMLDDGPGTTYSLTLARGGDTVWIAWAHQQGNVKLRVTARPLGASGLGTAHAIDLDGFSFGGEWARIAASANGAVLVYTQYGGVFAATATNGSWSAVAELDKISMTPGTDVGRPVVALDDRGNATAVWTRVPATGRRTTVVARARGGQWSAATQLDEGTGSTYVWTAGVDAAGRVTTAWTQSDTTSYTVWGAHLQ